VATVVAEAITKWAGRPKIENHVHCEIAAKWRILVAKVTPKGTLKSGDHRPLCPDSVATVKHSVQIFIRKVLQH